MNSLETIVRGLKHTLGLTSASELVRVVRPVYDWFLELFYARRGLVRVINGKERILIRPAHRYVSEDYEAAVFAYLRRSVSPGITILDVGAHVGLFTVLMARWAGADGRVFAFEPAPRTRAALQDHLDLNQVGDRVTVVPMAVSDTCGKARLYTATNSPENTLSVTHGRIPEANATEVEVTTIDVFCAVGNVYPAIIKIDIEGFEFHALRGARHTLMRSRPHVLVEMHPMHWAEIGVGPQEASRLLAEVGYRLVALENQADPLAEYGHVLLRPQG